MQGCKKFLKIVFVGLFAIVSIAFADTSVDELNKETQNPIANLTSLPFQNNWGFNVGPDKETDYLVNIQPVMPFQLSDHWNLITRTVLPVTNQPPLLPGTESVFGLSDTTFTAFLSPISNSDFTWGVGPAFLIPTGTDNALSERQWGTGPSLIALIQAHSWTVGILTNQIWSYTSAPNYPSVNAALFQPFVAYSFPHGWSTSFVSETTSNWEAPENNRWTVPLDLVLTKIVMFGKQPVVIGGGPRYFPIKPAGQATWGARFVVSFLFPK